MKPEKLMRSVLVHVAALAMFIAAASCDRFDPSDPPPPDMATGTAGGGVSGSQVVIEHPLFGGLEKMVAGDGELFFGWTAATDDDDPSADIFYRLYLATGPGDQDFANPDLETAPGATTASIDGLLNGEMVYAVLRAVDGDGNEDPNRVEWFAIPNRVVYVNGSGTGGTIDGATPGTAYRTVIQAIAGSISNPDVNIYVAQGVYSENAFLFPGMFMYGGFDGAFGIDDHDPDANLTELTIVPSQFTVDVVTMVGEEDAAAIGIDGFQLDGAGSADNIVKVEDAVVRVSNCALRNAQAHGLEILTSLDTLLFVEGFIRGCAIVDNGAEGIAIHALADLKIDSNLIENNTNEGIESQWLLGVADEDSRLDVTRNRIQGNGDEGVDLDLAEYSELDSAASAGARIRVLIRSNVIRNNGSSGVQIDIDFEDSDGIDARCRVEDNEISGNAVHGVALDADARSSFRVARNVITANGEWGLFIRGSASGPVFRLLHDRVLGNGLGGVLAVGYGLVDVRHCVLRGNQGPGIESDVGLVTVSNSVLRDQPEESTLHSIEYSILGPGEVPTSTQGDGVVEADPRLEIHPVGFSPVSAAGSGGNVPLADSNLWQVGDILELDDDGVGREVISVGATSVSVDPPPGSVAAGQMAFRFEPGSSVAESEALLVGSLAIDGGNPLEEDQDGTRPDIGPAGGDTPGNVGIETGIPAESASLELTAVVPSPGLPAVVGEVQSLTLNRALPTGFEGSLTVLLNGVIQTVPTSVDGNTIEFGPVAAASAGDTIRIELAPSDNAEPALEQRSNLLLESPVADRIAELEINDILEDAQELGISDIVEGVVSTVTDVDYYSIDLEANESLLVQLLAGQLESPLVARVAVVDENDVVLLESVASPPLVIDPTPLRFEASIARTLYVRVESGDATGTIDHRYQLVVRVEP